MQRLSVVVTLAGAVLLSACIDEPTSPQQIPARHYSVGDAASPRYIVAFRSTRGLPRDFETAVAALGGKVDLDLGAVGGAVISGVSAEGAVQIGGRRDVLAIEREGAFPLVTRSAAPQALGMTDAGVASVSAPQTAILFGRQWNLQAISAIPAWAAGRLGSATVTAAILDTGLDPMGLDQAPLIDFATSVSFVPEDDAVVQALFPGRHPIADLDGHGTNVGAQVSSVAFAFAGVTSRTRLMGVKVCSFVLDACPFGAIIAGVLHAVDNGADVINMSLGASFEKKKNGAFLALSNRLLQYAEQRGVTIVVAAGNNGEDMDHNRDVFNVFCDAVHVICVAATGAITGGPANTGPFGDLDLVAAYSNFGRANIDVAAPGGNFVLDNEGELVSAGWIWSLCTRSHARRIDEETIVPGICSTGVFITGFIGTSQAAPHVAGLAALLVSEIGRNPPAIRDLIKQHADDLGPAGTDPHFGRGRINVAATHP